MKTLLLYLAVLATVAFPATSAFAACVASVPGDSAPAINTALMNAGLGGTVYLCRYGVYPIQSPVRFQHPNQTLITETFDTGNTDYGQRAWIDINSPTLAAAVIGHDMPGSWLKFVQISGSEQFFGHLGSSAPALVDFGGSNTVYNGRTQEIHGCYVTEPRGWSAVYVSAGNGNCSGVRVTNNDIGPSGYPYDFKWTDGISYACRNGFVTGNYVFDATDGGIVIFGSPGSLIADNTVVAITRQVGSGIALADVGPYVTPAGDGDYRGTRVYHNTIRGQGAWIKFGIASGPYLAWPADPQRNCAETNRNDGALVDYNTVTGIVGYGYAVDGVRNWTIRNNTDTASHLYSTLYVSACFGQVSPPRRFQKYSPRSSGTFTNNSAPFLEAILDGAGNTTY